MNIRVISAFLNKKSSEQLKFNFLNSQPNVDFAGPLYVKMKRILHKDPYKIRSFLKENNLDASSSMVQEALKMWIFHQDPDPKRSIILSFIKAGIIKLDNTWTWGLIMKRLIRPGDNVISASDLEELIRVTLQTVIAGRPETFRELASRGFVPKNHPAVVEMAKDNTHLTLYSVRNGLVSADRIKNKLISVVRNSEGLLGVDALQNGWLSPEDIGKDYLLKWAKIDNACAEMFVRLKALDPQDQAVKRILIDHAWDNKWRAKDFVESGWITQDEADGTT